MICLFSKHTTLDADTLATQETGTSLGLFFIKFAYNNPLQTDQPHKIILYQTFIYYLIG